jgi:hypothetical protein
MGPVRAADFPSNTLPHISTVAFGEGAAAEVEADRKRNPRAVIEKQLRIRADLRGS